MLRKLLTTFLIFSLLTATPHARIDLEIINTFHFKGAVGASVNAAFGQRIRAMDVLEGIGTSVLADVLASTVGDLHAEGAISDAGQTALHVGSGAFVGGLMGGTEGAIASAAANLVADLAFKGLAPTKPTSLDPDEQKAYHDAIDRTAIAAKLLAPITIVFVTGGNATATGAAIASSSAVINENHMMHADLILPQDEQQQVIEDTAGKAVIKFRSAAKVTANEAAEFWENYGDQIAFAAEVIYCTRDRAIGGVVDTSRLSRLQMRAFGGRGYSRVGAAVPTKRSDPTRVSRRDVGGGSAGAGSSRPTPKAEKPSVSTSQSHKQEKPMLPGEGRVGSFVGLDKYKARGDKLAKHHMPNDQYMRSKGVSREEGISITVEHPLPGVGGRHRKIHQQLQRQDLNLKPRDALAQSVRRARKVYKEDGLSAEIRPSLEKVIKENKAKFPELFDK